MANSAFQVSAPPSVAGTTNQIVVFTGSAAVIAIAGTYAGQTSITTLGTITSGNWQGTAIAVNKSGTGKTTFTAYSVICAGTTSTGAMQSVSGLGTTGYVLRSNGASALPSWQADGLYNFGITSTTLAVSGSPITTSGTIAVNLPASVAADNLLLNGDFQVWQRGTSFSPGGSLIYGPDRWQVGSYSTQTATYSQIAGATSGSYLLRCQRNSGTSNTAAITATTSLPRDMCIGAAGNYVTVSFTARGGSDFVSFPRLLLVIVYSGTGSTDVSEATTGFTGSVNSIYQNQTLTTSLTRYSFTTSSALASNVTQLAVQVSYFPSLTAGANEYFDITDVKLEINTVATSFVHQSLAEIMPRALRFYNKMSVNIGAIFCPGFIENFYTAFNFLVYLQFPVQMRIAPSFSFPSAELANYAYIYETGTPTFNNILVVQSTKNSISLSVDAGSVTSNTGQFILFGVALVFGANPFFVFDAEIT